MSNQSTLTVALLNADLSVAYTGSLVIQFTAGQFGNLGTPTGAALTVGSNPLVLLSFNPDTNLIWMCSGANDQLSVSTWMNSAAYGANAAQFQGSVAGFATITMQGAQAQNLYIFGWDPKAFGPDGAPPVIVPMRTNAVENAAPRSAHEAFSAAQPPNAFDYAVTLLDPQLAPTGTGSIAAVGQYVSIGFRHVYQVTGNFTFTGGATCVLTGGGWSGYWSSSFEDGSTSYVLSTVTSAQGTLPGCAGGLVANGTQLTFVAGVPAS